VETESRETNLNRTQKNTRLVGETTGVASQRDKAGRSSNCLTGGGKSNLEKGAQRSLREETERRIYEKKQAGNATLMNPHQGGAT